LFEIILFHEKNKYFYKTSYATVMDMENWKWIWKIGNATNN
jgi:hypothetical protein